MEVQSGQGWTDAQLPPGDIFSFSPFFHHHLPPPRETPGIPTKAKG